MKYLILTTIILCGALKLAAQELPPDLQAGVDFAEKGPDKRLLEIMLDYRSVLEAELADLYKERDVLDKRLEVVDKSIRTHKILSWITIPLGLAAAGTGIYFLAASEEAYQNYKNADSADLTGFRETTELYDPLGYSLIGGGAAIAGTGTIIALTTPNKSKLEEDKKILQTKIQKLEAHLQ